MQVNLDKIERNLIKLKDICQKKIIAVLKADAYGCGDIHVARAVLEAGAEMIAVSSLDEALVLRNEGYEGKLLILGATEASDIPVLIKQGISCTAYSNEWVDSAIQQNCEGLHIHLKMDTGMSRIGFRTIDELHLAFDKLQAARCNMEGIFTHFCCADSDLAQAFLKDAVDDAIKAAESAYKYGVVKGCNVDLIKSIEKTIEMVNPEALDYLLLNILKDGFEAVYRTVLTNGRVENPDDIIKESLSRDSVYDLSTNEYTGKVINSMQTDREVLKATIDLIGLLIV